MGLLGASMSLGFMIGPAIGGFLSKVSLQFPFYIATAAALTAAVISIFALPNPAPRSTVEPGSKKKRENLFKQMKRSTTTPYFVMLIVMFVFSFGLANFQSTISLYVDHKYGYTPAQIAIIITVGGFVGVIAQTFVINQTVQTIWRNARHSGKSYHRSFCNDWHCICQFILYDSFRCNNFLHCHISSSSCRQHARFETCG